MEIDERTGLPSKPPIGYLAGLMDHLKSCFGSAIFALGAAFKSAGMALGPPILIIICLLQLHCQHLLVKCGNEVTAKLNHKPDFAEVGEGCFEFGHKRLHKYKSHMKFFTNFILILTLTGAICVYTVLFAESMEQTAAHWGYEKLPIKIWILLAFPPILILSCVLRNMLLVSYLSTVANILILVGIICVVYLTTTDMPEKYTFVWIGDLEKLPMFSSTGFVSFTLVQIVMPIYIESANPEIISAHFGILNVATFIEMTVTIAIGILSYRKYGEDCDESIIMNFDDGFMTQLAVITVGVSAMLTEILDVYVVVEALFPIISRRWGPFKKPEIVLFIFRFGYLLFTFSVAWSLPMFFQMLSLFGALGNTTLTVLPTIFHLALMWETMGRLEKIKDILIFAFGMLSMCSGVIASIFDIIENVHQINS